MNQYQQNTATIYSLQNYITELTVYINENNAKYTKNLQTLKTFYETQMSDLNQKININQQDKLILKNQLVSTKDLLNNRQKQIKDLKFKYAEINQQNQLNRQKLNHQRQKIDSLYDEISSIKKSFNQQLENQQKIIKQIDNQKNDLVLKLKEKQQQITNLKKQIFKLEEQLSQRYSLPQKLKDTQIQSTKNKTLVATLTQTKRQLQKKIDYQEAQIQRLNKQNKRLQINHNTKAANAKNQINEAVNKQKQKANQKQKRLESTNQKQLFQINELQNTLKIIKKQNSQLQKNLSEYMEENRILKQKILNHDNEKQKYIDEWRKLKIQYEEVIRSLQQAIPTYQKKIFDLEQENTDLNIQLDGLRDLLNEIKAMNSLQPLKHQYRQIAELELLAQKDYKFYKSQQKSKNEPQSKSNMKLQQIVQRDQNQFNWDKLLADIENIQVS